LKKIMNSEESLQNLRHFPYIFSSHLLAGGKYPELLQYGFVRKELSDRMMMRSSLTGLFKLYKDTLNMAEQLHWNNPNDMFRNIKSRAQLKKTHDYLTEDLHRSGSTGQHIENLVHKYGSTFPPPPIADNASIQAIRSVSELIEEGKTMQHCVASYAEKVFKRKCYIYKVISPERSTVEIDLREGVPHIRQLQLHRNTRPSQVTFGAVKNWLVRSLNQKAS